MSLKHNILIILNKHVLETEEINSDVVHGELIEWGVALWKYAC